MAVLLGDCVFVVTKSQRYQKIAKSDILYVRAQGSWVDIVTAEKTYRLSTNLGQLEPQLDARFFWRVSRSHMVNLHHITALQGGYLLVEGTEIPVGGQTFLRAAQPATHFAYPGRPRLLSLVVSTNQ